MKLSWRFWLNTGKQFFNTRCEFKITSDAMEYAVAYSYKDPSEWTRAKVLEAVKEHCYSHGAPEFWDAETLSLQEDERARMLEEARRIVEPLFPEAYEIVSQDIRDRAKARREANEK